MRPLIKRHISYDPVNEPDLGKIILFIILSVIGGAIILSQFGCSPLKKNSKAYERAALGNPVTPKDSSNAFVIAKKVVKVQPPKVIPGKTIKVPVTKIVKDEKALQKVRDSLNALYKEQASVSREELKDRVDEAFDAGYNHGVYVAEFNCPDSVPCPPVLCPVDTALQLSHSQLQNDYGLLKTQLTQVSTQRDIFKGEANFRFWMLLLLGAGLLTSVFFHFKGKFKPKNILNEISK